MRRLGALAPDDACALVRALAPRVSEAAAAELAAQCGHVPLALCVAAGALAADESLDPADYLARLRAAPRAPRGGNARAARRIERLGALARGAPGGAC